MLNKHLKDRISLLESATDVFLSKILKLEKVIFRSVRDIISSFESDGGTLKNVSSNRRKLFSLDKRIYNFFRKSNLGKEVTRFLTDFDEVERLNRLIYENTLDQDDIDRLVKLGFDEEKLLIIDQINNGLTNRDVITQNLVKPISNILIEGITRRLTIKEVQEKLRTEIISTDGQTSKVLRYVRQIAGDGLTQYDGAINDRIRDDLGLDGFFYVGSVIKTTRQNCFDLVNGSGKYSDLAIRKGVYKVSDIPEIIRRAKRCEVHHKSGKQDCGSGFNSAVTPETFAQYRMGYGCRHAVNYIRLLESDFEQ